MLLPKRLSSATRPKKEPEVKKVKKDRSSVIGLKRTRKSRDQICALQQLYDATKGKPTKLQLKTLSKDIGLKLQQVYKWYWDTEKKNQKLQQQINSLAPKVKSPFKLSRKILKTQYTDEFGGYSKTWFTDGLQKMGKKQDAILDEEVDDADDNPNNDFGMDCLAKSLGLDIEEIARRLALIGDRPPTQCHPVIQTHRFSTIVTPLQDLVPIKKQSGNRDFDSRVPKVEETPVNSSSSSDGTESILSEKERPSPFF